MIARVVLEDGTIFKGKSFGFEGDSNQPYIRTGEIVFNTSMSGYQEILTDPSYCKQIITMTYPLIGNYGVNEEDIESNKIQVEGFIVREYQAKYSNRRATKSLGDYLKEQKIPGIEGIDTRRLTKLIREKGALRGLIAIGEGEDQTLLDEVLKSPKMEGQNLVDNVTTKENFPYANEGDTDKEFNVIAMDYGMKTNILRMLSKRGCKITVVSAGITAEEILNYNPDGIFLSNGPGDPAAIENVVNTVKNLLGKKPIFGICLGHQILGQAFGGKTYKLKFGHRGANHPVKNLLTGSIEITSQNHGFTVDENSLPDDVEVSHINLNDYTVEGLRHKTIPAFSVQYHPESSPGPHDSNYLFDLFIEDMKNFK